MSITNRKAALPNWSALIGRPLQPVVRALLGENTSDAAPLVELACGLHEVFTGGDVDGMVPCRYCQEAAQDALIELVEASRGVDALSIQSQLHKRLRAALANTGCA